MHKIGYNSVHTFGGDEESRGVDFETVITFLF